jgi:hypothetical protein
LCKLLKKFSAVTSSGVVAPKIIASTAPVDENCNGEETMQSAVSIENNSNDDTSKTINFFTICNIHII